MEVTTFTIAQVYQGLRKKKFSAVELCQSFLSRIEKVDKDIHAFLTLTPELALSQAKGIDERIAKGENLDILSGIPCAIKDVILVEGLKCTAGSKILENYIAPYDSTVIKRLKGRGAVILGKTNLDEFAMGSSTENSAFGPTKNPIDLTRVPGGSSGGSAAAIAANFAVYSLGSDTGGSIRQPASFCGIVGLKPTYGAISRYGLMAFASSLDQIGPMTKTVEDCKIVFDAIKGKDEMDSTSVEMPKIPNTKYDIRNTKIGVPKEYFTKGIDPEVEKLVREAIKKFENQGVKIEEVNLPHTQYALACYYIIATSEASANLARYDGIKYGASETKNRAKDLLDVYFASRGKGFGAEVRRRIMLGTYTLSAGYYDAYYLRAQKVRTKIRQDFEKAFEKVDILMTPVSPFPAFKIGEKIKDPLSMYLSDIYTISVNLAGLPAISLPCGRIKNGSAGTSSEPQSKSSPQGLPVGLQIIGKPFEEDKILAAGQFFEELNPVRNRIGF